MPVKSFETDSNPQKAGSDIETVAGALAIEQVSRPFAEKGRNVARSAGYCEEAQRSASGKASSPLSRAPQEGESGRTAYFEAAGKKRRSKADFAPT